MAVDLANFLLHFPEFESAKSSGMIEARIAEAGRNVDPDVFGDKTDDGIRWLAADLLATTQFGQQARKKNEDETTTYGKRFAKLVRSVTPGFRVA